jgi:hypothetical protein
MSIFRTVVIAACSLFLLSSLCCAAESGQQPTERLLLIHPVPKSESVTEQSAYKSVYDGVVEKLTDTGYRVVDKATAEKCSQEIAVTHDIDPFANRAAAYGLKFFAEYTLFFKTSLIIKDNESGTGALIRASAKVIDNTTSRIITARSADSSSSGLTVEDAIDKAGRATGKKLAGLLTNALEKFHQQSVRQGNIYIVVFENTVADISPNQILSRLDKNAAVTAIKETESGGGKHTFEVNYKGKRDQLDHDITRSAESLGLYLQKIRAEGNRSSWKIINRGGSQ